MSRFGKIVCTCVWQEAGPVVFGQAPSPAHLHIQLLVPATALHNVPDCCTGIIRKTVWTSAVPWLFRMGHGSKFIGSCALVSILTPFQPGSALKLLRFSTFEKIPVYTCLLAPFASTGWTTILKQSWKQYMGIKWCLMLCLLLCLDVASFSLDETTVRMEFNNEVNLRNIERMPL